MKAENKEIKTAIKTIKDARVKAVEAAGTCKIEEVLKQVQIAGMARHLMPRVSPKDVVEIGREYENMVPEVASALRKGCRL